MLPPIDSHLALYIEWLIWTIGVVELDPNPFPYLDERWRIRGKTEWHFQMDREVYERPFVIFNSEVVKTVKFLVFVCSSLIVKQIYCFEAVFITHYCTHIYTHAKSQNRDLVSFFLFFCVNSFFPLFWVDSHPLQTYFYLEWRWSITSYIQLFNTLLLQI